MLDLKAQITLGILMLTTYVLLTARYTTADLFDEEIIPHNQLKTTTLSFAIRSTANNTNKSSLFTTTGIVPDGFDVGAIRIKKVGKMNFHYRITAEKTINSKLCDNLELKVMYKDAFIYTGKLLDFTKDEYVDNTNSQDFIFFVSLPASATEQQQACLFNFHLKTWRNSFDEKGGFSDEHLLANTITSGTW